MPPRRWPLAVALGARAAGLLLLLAARSQGGPVEALPPEAEAKAEVGGAAYRVQALSPTLVRVEQRGPRGFEDRATFLAQGRAWPGTPIRNQSASIAGARFSTDGYSVELGAPAGGARGCAVVLRSSAGEVLWRSGAFGETPAGLRGPAPSEVSGRSVLAVLDAPRFVPRAGGATPPAQPVPRGLQGTSGFDFGNHAPDIYLFVAAGGYEAMRAEFLRLSGSIPALPAWAFGLWFTWYHPYSQKEKTEEIQRFLDDDLGLSVVSLDRNWRQGASNTTVVLPDEGEYIVNRDLFPDMDGFLAWVHDQGLRTFFNDHPKYLDSGEQGPGSGAPEAVLAPAEVQFRWDGLTSLMHRGLDFWWFDCHWRWYPPALSVPGGGSVDGITWGQAVFQDITARYIRENRPEYDSTPFSMGCSESHHPASHRYPVWWTGDIFNTNLMSSVADMIRAGYEGFKPYVHPDCGGHHGHNEPEVYVRWIQFCSLGTIMRVHSDPWNDRRPWTYGGQVEDIFRSFVKLRLRLVPELMSASVEATRVGAPLVTRLDAEWPHLPGAARMDQYLLAGSMLVAPIDPFPGGSPDRKSDFNRSRSVWIPPGEWTDAFSGATVQGPREIRRADVPLDELPLYHRRGALVVAARGAGGAAEADWAGLVVHCWPPAPGAAAAAREFSLGARGPRATLSVREAPAAAGACAALGHGVRGVRVEVAGWPAGAGGWLLRVHLAAGERALCARADGVAVGLRALAPRAAGPAVPLGGAGERPGRRAGPTAEVDVPSSSAARRVVELAVWSGGAPAEGGFVV